jgi:hypothetical protein
LNIKTISKWVVAALIAALFQLITPVSVPAQATTQPSSYGSQGNDFYAVFNAVDSYEDRAAFFITSESNSEFTVTWPDGSTTVRNVLADTTFIFKLSSYKTLAQFANYAKNTVTTSGVIRLTSSANISSYLFYGADSVTDGSLMHPVSRYGTSFKLHNYIFDNPSGNQRSTIIASEDNTQVTISAFASVHGFTNGSTISFTLDKGEQYTIKSSTYGYVGGFVDSSNPITVFEYSRQTIGIYVPGVTTTNAYDYLIEQSLPISTWGREYVLVSSPNRLITDVFSVAAWTESTVVQVNGVTVATLNRGQTYTSTLSPTFSAAVVSASKPVMVAQQINRKHSTDPGYFSGSLATTGDPSIVYLPATNQLLKRYLVTTPAKAEFPINYALISIPTQSKDKLFINGNLIDPNKFVDHPGGVYSYAQIDLAIGSNVFESVAEFGLVAMGVDSADSYLYSAGSAFINLQEFPLGTQSLTSVGVPKYLGGMSLGGSANPCGQLSLNLGTWSEQGSTITNSTYQWVRNGLEVPGATSNLLSLAGMSVSDVIYAKVTRTNASGSATVFSPARSIKNLSIATISGVALSGQLPSSCEEAIQLNSAAELQTLFLSSSAGIDHFLLGGRKSYDARTASQLVLNPGLNNFTLSAVSGVDVREYSLRINYVGNPSPQAPILTTVSATSAQFDLVYSANGAAIVSSTLEVDDDPNFGSPNLVSQGALQVGQSQSLSATVNGLAPNSQFSARFSIATVNGTFYSPTTPFGTVAAPFAVTDVFIQETSTSASIFGAVDAFNASTTYSFQISTQSNFASYASFYSSAGDISGLGAEAVSASISGLVAGKTYYYRLVASNSSGQTAGQIKSYFLVGPPSLSTPVLVARGRYSITVEFKVEPNGSDVGDVWIEIGTSSNFQGTKRVLSASPGIYSASAGIFTSRVEITGLNASTTYLIAGLASNSLGSARSSTLSQATAAVAPAAPTLIISGPSQSNTSAVLLLTFNFSANVTNFDKNGVTLSGTATGWETRRVSQISPTLYTMQVEPVSATTGTLSFVVLAGAATLSADAYVASARSATFSIEIQSPPTVFSYGASAYSFYEGQSVNISSPSVTGTAPTGFTVSGLLSGLQISSNGAISGLAASGSQGSYVMSISALNGVGNHTATITITILAVAVASSPASAGESTAPRIDSFSKRVLPASGGRITFSGVRLGGLKSLTLGGQIVQIIGNTDREVTFETSNVQLGNLNLELANSYGQLTFLQAILVTPVVDKTTANGRVIGFLWTPKYAKGSINVDSATLKTLKKSVREKTPSSIICWGFVGNQAAGAPSSTAVKRRAEALCKEISKGLSISTSVRLRATPTSAHAEKVSIQIWKKP